MEITRLASILGALGLLLTAGGLGLPLLVPEAENSGSIVLGIGTVCLLGYVGIHFQGLVRGSRKRSARLGTHSILAILLATLAVGLTNFLADKHAPEWDFSETKNFTLSRQTYQVLRVLPRDVAIKVFTHEGSPGYGSYHDLLTTYANESPHLTVEFIDPERHPDKAKDDEVTRIDTAVIESGPQKIYLQRASEAGVTNALLRVTRDLKKGIAFTTGYSEKSVSNTETPGLSRAADALSKQGYDVTTIDWRDGDFDKASLLIIPSPSQPLPMDAVNHVTQFLRNGGRLLVLSDPSNKDSLDALLAQWGIQLGTGILADEQDRLGRGSPTALMVRTFTTHDITEDFTTPIIFPVSRSVTFDATQGKDWDFVALAQTSSKSWEETTLTNTEPVFNEDQDPKGPFTVAAVLTSKRVGQDQKPESAIVIVGNAAFATNGWLTYPGNTDFFLKTMAWLAKEDALVSLTPKEPAFHPFVPNPSPEQALVFFQVLVLPLLVLFVGLSVWKRRRSL